MEKDGKSCLSDGKDGKIVVAPKTWFRPANGMRSTRSLVEIHNTHPSDVFYGKCLYLVYKWEVTELVHLFVGLGIEQEGHVTGHSLHGRHGLEAVRVFVGAEVQSAHKKFLRFVLHLLHTKYRRTGVSSQA